MSAGTIDPGSFFFEVSPKSDMVNAAERKLT